LQRNEPISLQKFKIGVKNRASTNLKKVNLHLYISLRKGYTY
jgi:hypothetical protein